ncbi:MAG: ribosomal-processing cysteine protease Prp, partial [Clostridia bacterium]|nr:ribosomal-processing cysteine protease Prp [Clostridia bacterium]
MINYQCDLCSDRYIVSIEGHSNAAPAGEDIICAAASALALTM